MTSVGSGPGVVVVHGGGVTASMYRRLAERLSDRLTVHLYDRRGRADAPPRREPYKIADDVADLSVILRGTGARSVIGHSSGGYIALVASQQLAIERLVLYDAAVSIHGGFPAGWLPAAHAAAHSGDMARCMALTSAGINTHQPTARLPLVVQTMLCRLFLRTGIGATMGALLPATLDESQEIADNDGPASRWANISARVLLTYGAAGPRYYQHLNQALATAIPHATLLPITRHGHDGINRAPAMLVDAYGAFLG
ncbi:MAG TPA: alpha/beta hydrolase [Microlunatus sp.]|nr:alpha/beta hydrolase [Microlunatus sp.]